MKSERKPFTAIKSQLIVGSMPGTSGYAGIATALTTIDGKQAIILAADFETLAAIAKVVNYGVDAKLEKGLCYDTTLVSSKQIQLGIEQPEDDGEL